MSEIYPFPPRGRRAAALDAAMEAALMEAARQPSPDIQACALVDVLLERQSLLDGAAEKVDGPREIYVRIAAKALINLESHDRHALGPMSPSPGGAA